MVQGQGAQAERTVRRKYAAWQRQVVPAQVAPRSVAQLWQLAKQAQEIRLPSDNKSEMPGWLNWRQIFPRPGKASINMPTKATPVPTTRPVSNSWIYVMPTICMTLKPHFNNSSMNSEYSTSVVVPFCNGLIKLGCTQSDSFV